MLSSEQIVSQTVAGAEEIRLSGLPNQTNWFAQFRTGASGSCSFHARTHFGNSVRESTTIDTLQTRYPYI
jgi:hypothetical protein